MKDIEHQKYIDRLKEKFKHSNLSDAEIDAKVKEHIETTTVKMGPREDGATLFLFFDWDKKMDCVVAAGFTADKAIA